MSRLGHASASGAAIVAAARAQIGAPYIFGGGDIHGRTHGGFDCSGLALYAVYKGTGKKLAPSATAQLNDSRCHHVPFAQHQPGDLIFYPGHVAIASGGNKLIHAPKPGDHVREANIWSGHNGVVARCW